MPNLKPVGRTVLEIRGLQTDTQTHTQRLLAFIDRFKQRKTYHIITYWRKPKCACAGDWEGFVIRIGEGWGAHSGDDRGSITACDKFDLII